MSPNSNLTAKEFPAANCIFLEERALLEATHLT